VRERGGRELGRAGFVGRKRKWAGGEGGKREGGELLGWAERRGRKSLRRFSLFFQSFSF
jgi:hypothetical protein